MTRKQARAAALTAGVSHVHEIRRSGAANDGALFAVWSKDLTTAQLVASLAADPGVRFAEPDYVRRPVLMPDDTRFGDLWGMKKILATEAWNLTTGSASVVVADIDSGADYAHPDLAPNMWKNPGELGKRAGVDDDGNGYVDDIYGIDGSAGDADPMDDSVDSEGHGSHTAGTIGAAGNNALGVTGVCWNVRVMPLKFFGGALDGSLEAELACIYYAIWEKQHGVNVVAINASFGSTEYSQAESDAVQAAGAAGIVFVAAAGNGGDDGDGDDNDAQPYYPAGYPCSNIITVAATDGNDALTSFSNYGRTTVDLAAPGWAILSTVPTWKEPSGYESMPGTSMAAPHVTGTVALCAAQFPSDTVAQRIARVLNGVDKVGGLTGKCVTGGRLNAAKALGLTPSTGPEILSVDSSTHPNADTWYPAKTVSFSWEAEPRCDFASSLGWSGTGGNSGDIKVVGNKAYVALYWRGVHIVDVSNAQHPVELGGCEWQGFMPRRLAVSGTRVFAITDDFLQLIDASNPAAPQPVTFYRWENVKIREVAARDNYVFLGFEDVSTGEFWLVVLDVTDPLAATLPGQCQLPFGSSTFRYSHFELLGDYLYIGGDELRIVDVSDPTAPFVVGTAGGTQCCNGPAADDAYAYVADWNCMRVFDVSRPSAPRFVGRYDMTYGMTYDTEQVAITPSPGLRHHYAFLAAGDSWWNAGYVDLVDISNPLLPHLVEKNVTAGSPYVTSMVATDDRLYMMRDNTPDLRIDQLGPVGYSYVFDNKPGTVPDAVADDGGSGLSGGVRVTAASNGVWYLHVRAIGAGGDPGPTATRMVRIGPQPSYPVISGMDPTSGVASSSVRITGTGFLTSGTVKFGTTNATTSSWSATSIVCTVPNLAAGSYPVTVSNTNGTSSAVYFQVTGTPPAANPVITSLVPDSGVAGSGVVITGIGLGTSGTVSFGTTAAATTGWGVTSITCAVPSLSAGSYQVTVSTGGKKSNALGFTVLGGGTVPSMSFSSPDDLTKWHNHDIAVTFTVNDPDGDADVVRYSGDRVDWQDLHLSQHDTLVFSAKSDHSCDGDTTVYVKARDGAGHEGPEQSFHVRIDTRKPTAKAPSGATTRKGRKVTLKYRISDPAPNGGAATGVTIKIKNRSGRVVKTFKLGTKNVNKLYTKGFACKLPTGTYRFYVSGKDAAGNAAKVGSNRLSVR